MTGKQPKLEAIIVNLNANLDALLEKQRANIFETICFDIIYCFHTSTKYIITHDNDPPYDHSGMLLSTGKPLQYDDYDTIGDFLKEYTGETVPSFISGCGLSHTTYDEHFSEKIGETYDQVIYEFLSTLDENVLNLMFSESCLKNDYIKARQSKDFDEIEYLLGEIADYYELVYKAWDIQEMTMKNIRKKRFKTWYNRLGESVRKQVLLDREIAQQKHEEAQIRISNDKQELSVVWNRLSQTYISVYQEEIPKRIESPQYPEFMKFLKANGIKGHLFELIALYAPISFSNKVTDKLRRSASR